jgi:hypothetical protein
VTTVYCFLAALHLTAMVVTGLLWTIVILRRGSRLRSYLRAIRAVHFGSLYLVPMYLGLNYAFTKLHVRSAEQAVLPAGFTLFVLCLFLASLFPRTEGERSAGYDWGHGWPLLLAVTALLFLAGSMVWTAGILIAYSA